MSVSFTETRDWIKSVSWEIHDIARLKLKCNVPTFAKTAFTVNAEFVGSFWNVLYILVWVVWDTSTIGIECSPKLSRKCIRLKESVTVRDWPARLLRISVFSVGLQWGVHLLSQGLHLRRIRQALGIWKQRTFIDRNLLLCTQSMSNVKCDCNEFVIHGGWWLRKLKWCWEKKWIGLLDEYRECSNERGWPLSSSSPDEPPLFCCISRRL